MITTNEALNVLLSERNDFTKGTSRTVRPLSDNQESAWSWTAPAQGMLIMTIVSSTRTYININLNGTLLASAALPTTNPYAIVPISIPVRTGDVISITGLTTTCYIAGWSTFVYSRGGYRITTTRHLERDTVSGRRWAA